MYSTTFEHKLDNTTTYDAYDLVQDWVRGEGGRVKENRRPSLLVAAFGSSSFKGRPWERMARRTIRFDLSQPGSQVLVRVHVSSSMMGDRDSSVHGDEARFNWGKNLETLWDRLGGRETEAEKKETANPPANVSRSLRTGKYMTRIGLVVVAAGYLLVLFTPDITSFIVSGLGLILMVNGMMSVRKARKTLIEMGLEEPRKQGK